MTTLQKPLGSGFGANSTAADVIKGIDLTGKVAIVTGGYAGLGLENTRILALAGATVIVPARTPDKARKALAGLANVEQADLDLLNPASISAFAKSFIDSGRPLHMLINNAGIMALPQLTPDGRGYEAQFSANHLGHFQLTAELWPALLKAGNARVISVSSLGHRFTGIDFEDPNFAKREYNKWKAYGQSKTANILFALALDARSARRGVRALSLHPGRIFTTDLARHLSKEDLQAFGVLDENGNLKTDVGLKTIEEGTATNVWCATSPQLDGIGGVYCEDCDIAAPVPGDSAERAGIRPWAMDPEAAERLWVMTEKLIGMPFKV